MTVYRLLPVDGEDTVQRVLVAFSRLKPRLNETDMNHFQNKTQQKQEAEVLPSSLSHTTLFQK